MVFKPAFIMELADAERLGKVVSSETRDLF